MTMTDTNAVVDAAPHVGLVCGHCGCREFFTVYTRRRNDGIVRRKRCRHCGRAITTREKIIGREG